jgi:Lon protease-like protein
MSEALEKVSGIVELPIFPLPLVLLPNEILPLHIFEPRYRQMLEDVHAAKNIFGVSFFDNEVDFEKPANGSIGCAAEIRESQTLPDGRSNILTNGVIRYRILGYVDLGKPYLTAEVGFFQDDPEDDDAISGIADEVYLLFERIAKAAFKMSGSRGQYPEVPKTNPEALSFLVTAAFNLENRLKYSLLEMTSTSERLERLKGILLQAVDQIEDSADIHSLSRTNGHSKKKLDI